MRTARLTVMVWIVGLAVGSASAYACNEPKLGLGKSEASGGESVPFKITQVDRDAAWKVTVNGREVASGTATRNGTVAGTFSMPDLGSAPKTVTALSEVAHEGTVWPDDRSISYRPAAPTPSEQPTQRPEPQQPAVPSPRGEPAPAAPPAPPAGTVSPPSDHTTQPGGPAPEGTQPRPGRTRELTRRGASEPKSREIERTSGAAEQVGALAGSPLTADAGASTGGGSTATGESNAGTAEGSRSAAGGEDATIPADGVGVRDRIAVPVLGAAAEAGFGLRLPATSGTATPTAIVLGLAALLLLGGAAAAGVREIRRRSFDERGPDESGVALAWVPPEVTLDARVRDILMEAELQVMIEEHRARETPGELEPVA